MINWNEIYENGECPDCGETIVAEVSGEACANCGHVFSTIIQFDEIEVLNDDNTVKVCLSWIGEGISGDYIADDPEDEPLLRMDIYRKFEEFYDRPENLSEFCEGDDYEDGDWMYVNNSSYCTQLDARLPREQLIAAAKFILEQVQDDVKSFTRRNYDHLSWIELVDGQPSVCLRH